MIAMCHKARQIVNLCTDNAQTICITPVNSPTFFDEIRDAFECKNDFNSIARRYEYGIIKYNPKTTELHVLIKTETLYMTQL